MYNKEISKYNYSTDNFLIEENTAISKDQIYLKKIKVHIIGEINSPGLYELDEGSRINDLILLAGGKTQNANLNKINLAYELTDGEQIYIPSIFDENNEYNNIESNTIKNSTGKININKATLEELQKIPGVGPSLAQKIITYRTSIRNFNSIEELKNVSGIGNKKFESIKDFITLK